jgi:hypothetical protein
MYIYRAALINVFSVHMRQARRRQTNTGAADHPMLDRNVFDVMVFCVGCRFNFDQPPASVSTALENIYPDEI